MREVAHLANNKDSWKDSFDSYDAVQVGQGSSGCVLLIDEDLVVKIFSEDEDGMLDFERERDIFQHLQCRGYSKYIVAYKEQFGDDGLVLEHLGTTLRQRLRKSSPQPHQTDRYRWTKEACQALAFIHEAGVFHGDIGCHNFLMDKSSNGIKLCDFAGSKREDEDARVCYETRSQHPSYRRGNCTLATEIFALGSLIFEIIVGNPPLASEPDSEVRNRFKEKDFPLLQVEDCRMRDIIKKCWLGNYREASDIIDDIPNYF